MLTEFKTFLVKQNVLALALGVVIGAATAAFVTAIVEGLFMPVVGAATGGLGPVEEWEWTVAGITFYQGKVIAAFINFVIVAFIAFQFTKMVIRPPKPGEPPATVPCKFCRQAIDPAASRCPFCTSEIAPAA